MIEENKTHISSLVNRGFVNGFYPDWAIEYKGAPEWFNYKIFGAFVKTMDIVS